EPPPGPERVQRSATENAPTGAASPRQGRSPGTPSSCLLLRLSGPSAILPSCGGLISLRWWSELVQARAVEIGNEAQPQIHHAALCTGQRETVDEEQRL